MHCIIGSTYCTNILHIGNILLTLKYENPVMLFLLSNIHAVDLWYLLMDFVCYGAVQCNEKDEMVGESFSYFLFSEISNQINIKHFHFLGQDWCSFRIMSQLATESAIMRILSLLLLLLLLLRGTLTLPPGGCREVWRILEKCDMREHCDLLEDADKQ